MAGNHFSIVVSLFSLALAALVAAKPDVFGSAHSAVALLFLCVAIAALILAVFVALHGIGKGFRWANLLLDQWLGVEGSLIRPDTPLVDIVGMSCPNVVARQRDKTHVVPDGEFDRVSNVLDQIREFAAQSRLKVWGRKTSANEYRLRNRRIRIDPSYWVDHEIEYLRFLDNPLGKTARGLSEGGESYCDLAFSSRQVRNLFGNGDRIVFQKPWRRVQ